MTSYTLYSTSACHLCEVALALLEDELRERTGLAYEVVDISDCDELFERYGVRIPVLRAPGGEELGWPFDQPALRVFLENSEDSGGSG